MASISAVEHFRETCYTEEYTETKWKGTPNEQRTWDTSDGLDDDRAGRHSGSRPNNHKARFFVKEKWNTALRGDAADRTGRNGSACDDR